jgi:hypothetical protein
MRKNIRIENPVSGCGFTSKNRAKRFVAQGRAEWVQAGVSVDHTRWSYDRAANTGMAQIAELANLPMISPAVALGFGRRKGASRSTFLATQGF